MAHCPEDVRKHWTQALTECGIEIEKADSGSEIEIEVGLKNE